MNFRRARRDDPDINITSLIDVVLLLLIFFMISTTFNRETQVRIELPQASAEAGAASDNAVEIQVDAEGRYYVNDQALINTQPETLMRAIEKVGGTDTDRPVLIVADAKTPHQAVVTAMDVAGRLGFVHLRVATQRTEP